MYQFDKNTPFGKNLHYFAKWTVISVLIGLVTGLVGTVFGHAVLWVSSYFRNNPWTILFLPVCGLLITGIYHILKEDKNRGTNMVIESIHSGTEITFGTAPAVFLGTLLTHISGGSSGREGAALQLGGSIGNQIGKVIRLDEKDMKIADGIFPLYGKHHINP